MNEINLQVSTYEKSFGTNTNYGFNSFLLPSNFKLGDTVELELTDYYFIYDENTENNNEEMITEMNVNGLKLEQLILGPNSNSPWIHINMHKNELFWINRAFWDSRKYRCIITDLYLQFNFRVLGVDKKEINDTDMGDQVMSFQFKKIN
jgi:hypothetical protein